MIVTGQRQLYQLGHAFHSASHHELAEALDRGGDAAGKVIADEVRRETDFYMPRGYERVWARALVTKVVVRRGVQRRITISGRAFGARGHDRQARQLEAGELRHPIYGRYRELKAGGRYARKPQNIVGGRYKNPWKAQRVRPHWFTEPARHAEPRAVFKLDVEVGKLTRKIEAASI